MVDDTKLMEKTRIVDPRLLAHRGLMDFAPENTPLSFQLAAQFGFAGVELDIHLSADGEAVIIHDETTERVGDANIEVASSTLEELRKVDLGYFWKFKLPFQQILTLREFCQKYLKYFEIVNLELKTDVREYPGLEEIVSRIILSLKKTERAKFIISSFNFNSLKKYKQLDKERKVAFLFSYISKLRALDREEVINTCDYLNPWAKQYLSWRREEIDSYGLKYMIWTIKSKKAYNKLIADDRVAYLIANRRF